MDQAKRNGVSAPIVGTKYLLLRVAQGSGPAVEVADVHPIERLDRRRSIFGTRCCDELWGVRLEASYAAAGMLFLSLPRLSAKTTP